MDSFVALDIETTGLDPEKDSIIEIGAVRFSDKRVEGEWSNLINPGKPIPPFITQLTGITDQMVLQSPPIREVLQELADFIGDAVIIGHNIGFDLSFFKRFRLFQNNEVIDTYELASVLLPTADRYNLGALAQSLGVLLPATHRALDDAQATRGVYLRLYEEIFHLPLNIIAEIVRLSEAIEWWGYRTFRQVLRERTKEIVSPDQVRHAYRGPLFEETEKRSYAPLQPVEKPTPLNTEEVASALQPGGLFSRFFPQFEYRPQQVSMLQAVCEALSQGNHLMVEAGTGIGKSMAYLVPAALWSIKNNYRVIISTNTINLQEQLINKDIPDLKAALGLDLQAAVLKGRSNYLCPRRLENFRRRGPSTAEEMRVLGKILVWLQGTHSGDRSEINLNGPNEREIWMRFSAEDEGCTMENCIKRTGGICPYYRVRQASQSAHILIVNHALLLADVATGNRILPEYEYIIIDEAHHLEEATTDALSFKATQGDIDRLLRELGSANSGALSWLLSALKDALSPTEYGALNSIVSRATDQAFRLENYTREFFASLDEFLIEQRKGYPLGPYSQQERILQATRTQPAWVEVERTWEDAEKALIGVKENLGKLAQAVADVMPSLTETDEELYSRLINLYRRFEDLHNNITGMIFDPSVDRIYWTETSNNNHRISLHNAPLHIGTLMQQYLWHQKTSVIITSATLTAGGEFNYIRGRLFAEEANELSLGSPFDYENAALLYIANDIPEPNDRRGHQHAVETALINLCRATGGRTLALFTSYDQLRRTSQVISPILSKHNITVYEQGEGASPHTLLESFRITERAVLLGTRAFWEGVDVPGEALSVLVMVKLPFDVPSDPIVAARSETFDDPFSEYSLPEAILKFRQGFGRLIRTQSDRGAVVILDKRILSKKYGRSFLESLPPVSTKVGSLSEMPRIIQKWLNI
jgi:ATP-dependent DNA helicase DinG